MIKEKGSATLVTVGIIFIVICTLLFFVVQTSAGNDLLMKSLGLIEPQQSSPEKHSDTQAAYMGEKVRLPDGTIGCKQDVLACPDGKIEKRTLPTCTFPRCP